MRTVSKNITTNVSNNVSRKAFILNTALKKNTHNIPTSKQEAGLTLIELMIVVAVVGILAAIALPSFLGQTLKSNRVDASHSLLEIATQQELYYMRTGAYASTVATLGLPATSDEGFYTLAIGRCGTQPYSVCYRSTATAIAGEAQERDTKCRTFALTSRNERSAVDTGGNDTSDECW